jgi:hypothetical protein
MNFLRVPKFGAENHHKSTCFCASYYRNGEFIAMIADKLALEQRTA